MFDGVDYVALSFVRRPEDVERLFSADFVHLQELFVRLNDVGGHLVETECPECGTRFPLDVSPESGT